MTYFAPTGLPASHFWNLMLVTFLLVAASCRSFFSTARVVLAAIEEYWMYLGEGEVASRMLRIF